VCGLTLREGVRRADGSLDRAGFLGGAADMIKCAARIQAPWLAEARAKGREGWPPTQLMRAAYEGNEPRVRELVAAGAPLDLVSGGGDWSALYLASMQGHARIAKLLLDGKFEGKGADIDLQVKGGWTPLVIACMHGYEAVARLLLGAKTELQISDGPSARLYYARSFKHVAIVALLEAHGAPE
jgi:ankyrin repeat protein